MSNNWPGLAKLGWPSMLNGYLFRFTTDKTVKLKYVEKTTRSY